MTYMSANNANSLDAFVTGVKLITGEENPNLTLCLGAEHDRIWIFPEGLTVAGDKKAPSPSSQEGQYLESLGFHWDSHCDSWAWFT